MTIQQEIRSWQEITFGEAQTPLSVCHKMEEEIVELESEVYYLDFEAARKEAADVGILLFGLSEQLGFDLLDAIQEKFIEVKNRKWQQQADGGFQHVPGS